MCVLAPSSTVTTLDTNFLISVTWTAFLHSGVAQDVLDPPTYLESAVDSTLEAAVDSTLEATVGSTLESAVDSALEALPREVVINRWHEFRASALQNNEIQINEAAEYNPWGSKANLVPSSQWS